MSFQDRAQAALRASLTYVYGDGTLTQTSGVTITARGDTVATQSAPIAIKMQREMRGETLERENVSPNQALFYVIAEPNEGDVLTYAGEIWRIASVRADPVNAAPACVCDKVGDAP